MVLRSQIASTESVFVNMNDLEETNFANTTLFDDMLYDSVNKFTLLEDSIQLTSSLLTSYNETIAYIDLIIDFAGGEFQLREAHLRENSELLAEIAERKNSPKITDTCFTYKR